MTGATSAAVCVPQSLDGLAREVYAVHQDTNETAIAEYLYRVRERGLVDDLLTAAAYHKLDAQRLRANQAHWSRASGLRERLSVQSPPVGYREPTALTLPLRQREAITIQPGAIASFRSLFALKVRVDRKVMAPQQMTREQMNQAIQNMERQRDGLATHIIILKDWYSHMLAHERGIDTLKRLEREVDG